MSVASNKERLTLIAWWVAALAITVLMLAYIFPRGFYHQPDLGWVLYTVQAAAKSMHHQDFMGIWRPGYLLNVPMVWLGLTYLQMKWVYFACLLVSFLWFVFCLDKSAWKTKVLPLCLITLFAVYMAYFRFIFNYYGNVPIFVMLAIASFLTAKNRQGIIHYALVILSGLCWSQVAFASLSVSPAVFASVLFTCIYQRRWSNLLLLVSFVFFLALALYLFLDLGHAWSVYLAHRSSSQIFKLFISKALVAICFLLMVVAALCPYFFRDFLLAKGWWQKAVDYWLIALFLVFVLVPGVELSWLNKITFAPNLISVAAFVSICVMLVHRYGNRLQLLVVIPVLLLMIGNRILSDAAFVSWLYIPLLLMVFWVFFQQQTPSRSHHRMVVLILLLCAISPFYRLALINYASSISFNQYDSKLGVKVDLAVLNYQTALQAAYQKNDCAQKPLLAYFDLADVYYLVDRVAPFGQAWVSAYKMEPESRQLNTKSFENWFRHNQHWCVVYRYSAITARKHKRFLPATALMKKLATHYVLLQPDLKNKGAILYVR